MSLKLRQGIVRAGIPVSRVTPKTTVHLGASMPGGMTSYGPRNTVTGITVGRDRWPCYERTVELHELLHAKNSKIPAKAIRERFHPLALQAFEDMRVQGPWFTAIRPSERQRRDATAAMLLDLRAIKTPTDAESWNVGVVMLCRCKAIAESVDRGGRVFGKAVHRLCGGDARSMELVNTVLNIVYNTIYLNTRRKARRGWKAKCIGAIDALMRQPVEDQRGTEPKGNETLGYDIEYVTLPLTHSTKGQTGLQSANTGAIIRQGRLVPAIIGNTSRGLFVRRLPAKPIGTVLIDASSSMGVDAENLTTLCASIPSATVAFYNGRGRLGRITLFARDGRRANALASNSLQYGSNDCDYPAIQWLLRQRGPHYLVSDMEFCGGVPGDAERASVLVKSNSIKVIGSIDEAIRHFK